MTDSLTNLFNLIASGGWTTVPLIICSVLALAIIFERSLWGLRLNRNIPENFKSKVFELVSKNKIDEIKGLCLSNDSSLSRITSNFVENINSSKNDLESKIEITGKKEFENLKKNLPLLGTIAAISPLLGLLGTVFGMISTFDVINKQGIGDAQALSGGISEALISTAFGLSIAIPSLFFYRFFLDKAKNQAFELEKISKKLIETSS